jgi:hypothetical protein
MIDDVPAAIEFYMTHLGFALETDASPAFASVARDGVRLLLSGKTNSGRRPCPTVASLFPGDGTEHGTENPLPFMRRSARR